MNGFELWSGLLGGLALFLFGLDILTRALKVLAGDRLRTWLGRLTANRFLGVFAGASITAIINSSSVTTVLLVGFISAGLMTFAQGIAVVMGANIGSTMTAQVLAFNVTALALPMIAPGFALSFLGKQESWRQFGSFLLGLGLVFFGMGLMSEAMAPLREYPPFLEMMERMDRPLAAVALGAVFTGIVQSSAATTGIVIVLAGQGLISLEGAIAIALGANIGTCVTAGLSAIGKPREATRLVVVHVLFNVVGVLLWIPLLTWLADLSRAISPAADGLVGQARIAAETPRQVANAHTIFNIANTFLFIWFTPQIAALVTRFLPDKPIVIPEAARPRFLDTDLLNTPALAANAARLEIARLGKHARDMVADALGIIVGGTAEDLARLSERLGDIDLLYDAILRYLAQTQQRETGGKVADEITDLLQSAGNFQAVADIVATNMVRLGYRRLEANQHPSAQTLSDTRGLESLVLRDLDRTIESVRTQDAVLAEAVRQSKHETHAAARKLTAETFERLVVPGGEGAPRFAGFMDVMDNYSRIHRLCRKIARTELYNGKRRSGDDAASSGAAAE
jgi:phosphate:Na+ symporter